MSESAVPFRHDIARHSEEISRCVKCGACRAICPSFLETKAESFSPRGRMALIKAALSGRISASAIFANRLDACTSCLACETACASGVPVSAIFQAAREWAARERGRGLVETLVSGILKTDSALQATSRLAPLVLHYSRSVFDGGLKKAGGAAEPGPTNDGRENRGAKGRRTVAFFPGCSVNYFQGDIGKAAITVLNSAGFDVVIPEGLKCCGRPLLSLGNRQAAAEAARRNAALFFRSGVDTVITPCPSCSLTFKREYPTLLRPGDGAPLFLDIHEVLANAAPDLALSRFCSKITWHDPCHLSRGQGLGRKARDVLKLIPGVVLAEMENPDRCCGFGGAMRTRQFRLSDGIAAQKAKSIIRANAAAVVTGCPSCRMQIREGLRRAGSELKTFHIVQVIAAALASANRECRGAAAEPPPAA